MAEQHRYPVSTYPTAISWLLQHAQPEEWLWDASASLPKEARLVCDMFWVNEAQLIADLRKEWDVIMGYGRPRKHLFKGVPA